MYLQTWATNGKTLNGLHFSLCFACAIYLWFLTYSLTYRYMSSEKHFKSPVTSKHLKLMDTNHTLIFFYS